MTSEDAGALDRLTWLQTHNNLGRLYILNEQYRTAWIPLDRAFDSIQEAELTDTAMQVEHYTLLKNLSWLWLEQERSLPVFYSFSIPIFCPRPLALSDSRTDSQWGIPASATRTRHRHY